jgi:membrane protein required for colicin V production
LDLIDIAILVTLLIPAVVGVIYGFLNIILSIVSWGVAFSLAAKFSNSLSPLLSSYVENEFLRDSLAFFAVFILCLIILSVLGYFMLKLLGRAGLTAADRILGLVFGIGLGGAIVAAVVFLAGFTDLSDSDWWQESLIVSPFERIGVWGRQFLPDYIANGHHYGPVNEIENQGG